MYKKNIESLTVAFAQNFVIFDTQICNLFMEHIEIENI